MLTLFLYFWQIPNKPLSNFIQKQQDGNKHWLITSAQFYVRPTRLEMAYIGRYWCYIMPSDPYSNLQWRSDNKSESDSAGYFCIPTENIGNQNRPRCMQSVCFENIESLPYFYHFIRLGFMLLPFSFLSGNP